MELREKEATNDTDDSEDENVVSSVAQTSNFSLATAATAFLLTTGVVYLGLLTLEKRQ